MPITPTSIRKHVLVAASLVCVGAYAQQPANGAPPFRQQPQQRAAAQEAAADAALPRHVRGQSDPESNGKSDSKASSGLAAVSDAKQASATPGTTAALPRDPRAMKDMQDAADHLRESIRALAQKSGPERQAALEIAHRALMQTENAMHALPNRLQAPSDKEYSRAVQQMMAAADALRASVQNLALQPADPSRNKAIRSANKALLDTQRAMATAYDASLGSSGRTGAMGAGSGIGATSGMSAPATTSGNAADSAGGPPSARK